MSFSFSSPQVSPGPDPNQLFDAAKVAQAGQAYQSNQLHMQGQQIDLSNANMAQVGQAAAGLLSAYPDEASRAAAYPRVVGMLQSQGYALHAPSEYPGEGVLRSMVNQSIPAKDLYSSGALLTPAQQAALGQTGQTGTTGTSTTGAAAPSSVPIPARGTGGPGASASAPTAWLPYYEEASQKYGVPVDLLIAQTRQESGFNPNAKGQAGEIGLFQIKPSTATNPGFGMQGVDPASLTGPDNVRNNIMFGAQYLRARMGGGDPTNPAVQAAGLHAYNGGGDPNYVANVFRYRPTLAPSDPNAAITAYTPPTAGATTATAAPTTAQPGQPVPTQVASNTPMVSTAPAASTAAPGGPPAAPQFTYPNGKVGGAPDAQGGVHYADGNYGTPPPGPRVPVAGAAPAPAQPSAAQPGQPQGPATAPAAAPGGTSRLPDASTIPTGRNSAAWQQAQQLIDQGNRMLIVAGSNAGMRASAERMIQQGTQQQQLDHMVPAQQDGRPGNLNTTTGAFTPYAPLPSPRFSQPTIDPATGKPAIAAVSGSGTQYFPIPERPAGATWELQKQDYEKDQPQLTAAAEQAQNARTSQIRWQTMLDLAGKLTKGAGGATRTQLANLAETAGFPGVAQALIANSSAGDASAAQEFTKLSTQAAGADARADLGSRAGLGAIRLFQSANPNLDLRPGANKGIIGMQLIAAQADADFNNAKLAFGNQQAQSLRSGGAYLPLTNFDQQWQAQRNPQVYAAAMGALQGQPAATWTKGLSDDEYQRALDVVSRASPSAVVNGKTGRLNMQPQSGGQAQAQPGVPTVGTVQQGYRFNGGDPSNQANWAKVQ